MITQTVLLAIIKLFSVFKDVSIDITPVIDLFSYLGAFNSFINVPFFLTAIIFFISTTIIYGVVTLLIKLLG